MSSTMSYFKHWSLRPNLPEVVNLEDSGDEGADLTQFFEVKAEEEEVLDPYIIDSPQIPVEGEGAAQGEGGTKGGEEDVLMETLVEMDPYGGVEEEASENIHPKEHEGEQDMDLKTRSKTEALQDQKTSISEKTEEAEKPKSFFTRHWWSDLTVEVSCLNSTLDCVYFVFLYSPILTLIHFWSLSCSYSICWSTSSCAPILICNYLLASLWYPIICMWLPAHDSLGRPLLYGKLLQWLLQQIRWILCHLMLLKLLLFTKQLHLRWVQWWLWRPPKKASVLT